MDLSTPWSRIMAINSALGSAFVASDDNASAPIVMMTPGLTAEPPCAKVAPNSALHYARNKSDVIDVLTVRWAILERFPSAQRRIRCGARGRLSRRPELRHT
ncbi:hypothetical protein GCM10009776_13820 [Microbacterium deminutum]|uniref:Uncharacterized protein n=1 Tax=Microbacterium deminutum TaxID=344164 RepID=A0ABP5BV76_9MICO